jgi:protein SCO1/2
MTAGADLARTALATLTLLALGLALIGGQTAGFRAFTSETLRRVELLDAPKPLSELAVVDERNRHVSLPRLIGEGGKVWLVDFVYTSCTTLCLSLGTSFQQLQRALVERGLEGRVGLLSISFDPARDTPVALRDYARRMHADPRIWKFATLADGRDARRLLDEFGIVVIRAPAGEFDHNAAIHVVDARARLQAIFELSQPAEALSHAAALAPRDAIAFSR